MSQVQTFLNKYGSGPQANREDLKIWLSKEETERSPICIDRYDDGRFAKRTEPPSDDYSSCIYCEVDPEAFWEFLYSDEWSDSVILRVFSGELYRNLDVKLNEMVKEFTLSKHVTSAYLQVKDDESEMEIELNPETVRIEFTYYGKNLEKRPTSTATTFSPNEPVLHNSLSANSNPSVVGSHVPGLRKHLSEIPNVEPQILGIQESNTPSPNGKNYINISLAHHCSLNAMDIKDSFDSDCDMWEIKRRGKLGLSKNTFLNSQTSFNMLEFKRRVRSGLVDFALENSQSSQTSMDEQLKQYKAEVRKRYEEERKNRKGKDEDGEDSGVEKLGETPKQKIGKRKGRGHLKKGKQMSQMDHEVFIPEISAEIDLDIMGKIMEGERFLKFQKMDTKTRKRFVLSDERIIRIRTNINKLKEKKKNKIEKTVGDGKMTNQFLFKRLSGLKKNLYEFALLVLGITDSVELYRSLIWIGRDRNYAQGKWRNWFESRFKAKTAFQNLIRGRPMKKPSDGADEKGSNESELNVEGQDDTINKAIKLNPVKVKIGKGKAGKVMIGKSKPGKGSSGKVKIEKYKPGQYKPRKYKPGLDKDKANKDKANKAGKGDENQAEGPGFSGDEAKMVKKPSMRQQRIEEDPGEDDEEEEEEEEEEEKKEEEEVKGEEGEGGDGESDAGTKEQEPQAVKYDWEISGNNIPDRLKTKIVIPNFTTDEHAIRSEMILTAINDFIIRKERVTSSKDLGFTSLAFIRPSFAKKLFEFQ